MQAMKACSSYSLQTLPPWYPMGQYRRRLIKDGQPVGTVVNGDEIGLQMACGEYTLLATSYDYFDGCGHWIYLLGADGKPVDQLSMPDQFGFILDIEVVSTKELSFGYFGTNDRWNLVVYGNGFWSYAPRVLRTRLNRFLFAKRHIELKRTRGAPWSLPAASNSRFATDASRRST